jgi:hypothetical protein
MKLLVLDVSKNLSAKKYHFRYVNLISDAQIIAIIIALIEHITPSQKIWIFFASDLRYTIA